jgi:malonyl-CoA/methylmalonyl-CoA synthetase
MDYPKALCADFHIFRYLSSDPHVMKDSFDAEGFFRTGDIGRREGDLIFILGRASQDGM